MTNAQIRVSNKLTNAEVSRESIPNNQICIVAKKKDRVNSGRSAEKQIVTKRAADSETDGGDVAEEITSLQDVEDTVKVHETAHNLTRNRNNESIKIENIATSVEREAQECIPPAVEYCAGASPDNSVDVPVVQDVTEPNVEVGKAERRSP